MLTHPPWSRLGSVRAFLRELCARVAERVVRLLSAGLGEDARGAAATLLLPRPRPQPRDFHEGVDPFEERETEAESEFPDEFDFDDVPLPVPTRTPLPVAQPRQATVPLWKRTLAAGLRGARWCLVELPARHPVLTTVGLAAVLALVGCWLETGLSLLSLIMPNSGPLFS
jgi:hypothetical protein